MIELKQLKDTGCPNIIKDALNRASDEQLSGFMAVLGKKSSVLKSEEKIYQICHILISELSFLDDCVPHIASFKAKAIETFTSLYGQEYHSEKGTTYEYDNDRMMCDVGEVIQYRKVLRQATTGAVANSTPPPAEQGCEMM